MNIIKAAPWELSAADRRRCRSLCLRKNGMMSEDFEYLRKRQLDSRCFLIKAPNGTLLGWALLQSALKYQVHVAYFYVRRSARRRGIGTWLMELVVKEVSGEELTYFEDFTNEAFFTSCVKRGLLR